MICLSEYKRPMASNHALVDHQGEVMKIVVFGGTGLIGSKLVNKLREHGHEAVAAAPNTGVNTLTGEGLAEVLKGASVVVDVSNSPSWEDSAVLKFFETSTRNLLTSEAAAGVGHHVALSTGVARIAVGPRVNGIVEIGERLGLLDQLRYPRHRGHRFYKGSK
jgi:NAD(P)-dependent dehydrogenase (short-subunit alcohol dehydrogenase family)